MGVEVLQNLSPTPDGMAIILGDHIGHVTDDDHMEGWDSMQLGMLESCNSIQLGVLV